jgi:hypothetical protein
VLERAIAETANRIKGRIACLPGFFAPTDNAQERYWFHAPAKQSLPGNALAPPSRAEQKSDTDRERQGRAGTNRLPLGPIAR